MNIPKAIEILGKLEPDQEYDDVPEYTDAIKLGIEALKRERECRENAPREEWLLLPGETKD